MEVREEKLLEENWQLHPPSSTMITVRHSCQSNSTLLLMASTFSEDHLYPYKYPTLPSLNCSYVLL